MNRWKQKHREDLMIILVDVFTYREPDGVSLSVKDGVEICGWICEYLTKTEGSDDLANEMCYWTDFSGRVWRPYWKGTKPDYIWDGPNSRSVKSIAEAWS